MMLNFRRAVSVGRKNLRIDPYHSANGQACWWTSESWYSKRADGAPSSASKKVRQKRFKSLAVGTHGDKSESPNRHNEFLFLSAPTAEVCAKSGTIPFRAQKISFTAS